MELTSETECRNSMNDDINITINCTLPNAKRPAAAMRVNGRSIRNTSERSTVHLCSNGSHSDNNCITNTTTVVKATLTNADIPTCLYEVTCLSYVGSDVVSSNKSFLLNDCILLPAPVCTTSAITTTVTITLTSTETCHTTSSTIATQTPCSIVDYSGDEPTIDTITVTQWINVTQSCPLLMTSEANCTSIVEGPTVTTGLSTAGKFTVNALIKLHIITVHNRLYIL